MQGERIEAVLKLVDGNFIFEIPDFGKFSSINLATRGSFHLLDKNNEEIKNQENFLLKRLGENPIKSEKVDIISANIQFNFLKSARNPVCITYCLIKLL